MGWLETLLGKLRHPGPSAPGRAPWPPFMKNIFTKRFPAGVTPAKYTFHKGEPDSATTRSGSTGARAPKMAGGT